VNYAKLLEMNSFPYFAYFLEIDKTQDLQVKFGKLLDTLLKVKRSLFGGSRKMSHLGNLVDLIHLIFLNLYYKERTIENFFTQIRLTVPSRRTHPSYYFGSG
jgi:hypothetical protein